MSLNISAAIKILPHQFYCRKHYQHIALSPTTLYIITSSGTKGILSLSEEHWAKSINRVAISPTGMFLGDGNKANNLKKDMQNLTQAII